MFPNRYWFLVFVFLTFCSSDDESFVSVKRVTINGINLNLKNPESNPLVEIDKPIEIEFSSAVDLTTVENGISLIPQGSTKHNLVINATNNNRNLIITVETNLASNKVYTLLISSELKSETGDSFKPFQTQFKTKTGQLQVTSLKIDNQSILLTDLITDISTTPTIEIIFSVPLASQFANSNYIKLLQVSTISASYQLSNADRTLTIIPDIELSHISKYELKLMDQIKGENGESFTSFVKNFYTSFDLTPKFPIISDDELLTKVQQQTFKYFWDFAHPASGMARERNTSGDLVTSGGSGFGLMSIIVGIERGFITRSQGIERFDKILDFLETADRFHGAWSHWINGNTGDVIPFSANDNGGDLVETSFLVQGLITVRQYLNAGNPTENALRSRITALYQGVEWDWYRRENQNVMYWHWSSDKGWAMNLQVRGWNEALMVYLMAAASPTHTIPKVVYDNGWANNGNIRNGNVYEGITLPLGYPYGGPLFLSQYSFLGLDPRGLSDAYCSDYFNQNKNHSLINYKYCIRNPKDFVGYSSANWGLTASDNHQGYNAHSPTNDLGVITPTAALSAFPFTPDESMEALKFFYYTMGDKLWGQYGFYDAFNITENWYANSYLAIDQGPIIIMIENHRTGLLWDLFMSAPEVQAGLDKLGFTY